MFFPDSFIEEIKQKVQVSKVVGRRVKLKRAGNIFKGLCPFHNEKTPSFTVSDQKGLYHCFGCQENGDIISFVSKTENLSFTEAVKYLADLHGISMPVQNVIEEKKTMKVTQLVEVMKIVANWYSEQLGISVNREAYEYLVRRNINNDDIKTFGLGYAPAGGLIDFLNKKKIKLEDAEAVGLLFKSDSGRFSERFKSRIMFPIFNLKNQVVGFGGRALSSEVMPKYLNSPETILFKKNALLYAGNIARHYSIKNERMIVVEGYIDAIFMHKIGLKETVATLGTAFNSKHLELLWSMANEPILCFDGDVAGKKAMLKALHSALPILRPGLTLKFCSLPDGQDPADVIQNSGKNFIKTLLEKSLAFSDFLWQSEISQNKLNSPEDKALFEHNIYELVKQINHPVVKSYYQQFVKDKLWNEFRQVFIPKKNSRLTYHSDLKVPVLNSLSQQARLEYSLTAQLIVYSELIDDHAILEDYINIEFTNQDLDFVREIILKCHENKDFLLNHLLKENNLGKLTEFLCGKNSSFINNISNINISLAKEIWLITYKKYLLEKIKIEHNNFMLKACDDNEAFYKAEELKKNMDILIKEITEKEHNII